MTPNRFAAIASGMTGVAKKVLEAVPMNEPWDAGRVRQEVRRLGHQMESHIIDGCLRALREGGLIRESSPGCYVRVAVRPKLVHQAVASNEDAVSQEEEAASAGPVSGKPLGEWTAVDRLANLAHELRILRDALESTAKSIEDIALDIEADAGANTEAAEKLAALQKLLKGIAG